MIDINALRQDLIDFKCLYEAENKDKKDMLELLKTPRPFDRNQFDPGHFTGSAFVLSPNADAILLIFHQKLKLWLQPGGHVDPKDPSMQAVAARELAEETGVSKPITHPELSGPLAIDIHNIPARKSEPEHLHFDIRYLFVAPNTHIQAASDALDARWVPFAELTSLKTDESVRKTVRRIHQVLSSGGHI